MYSCFSKCEAIHFALANNDGVALELTHTKKVFRTARTCKVFTFDASYLVGSCKLIRKVRESEAVLGRPGPR